MINPFQSTHSDLWSCFICCFGYNRVDHVPKMIPTCGHTVCSTCLKGLFNAQKPAICPLDRMALPSVYTSSESLPTNILILQLLDEKSKADVEICGVHREPKTLACLTEKMKLCKQCIANGSHKNHNVKTMVEVKNEAITKRKRLENLVEEFETIQDDIYDLLGNQEKSMLSLIKEKFKYIRENINRHEEEICVKVKSFFKAEKLHADSELEKDSSLKERLRVKISDLNNTIFNERFFKTLNSEVRVFGIKDEYKRLQDVVKTQKASFELLLNNYVSSLAMLSEQILRTFTTAQNATETSLPSSYDERVDIEENKATSLLDLSILDLREEDGALIISPKDSATEDNLDLNIELLKDLKQAKVNLTGAIPTFQFMQALEQVWNELEQVSSVYINTSNTKINEENVAPLLTNSFWAKKNIQSVGISLESCDVGDQTIIKMLWETFAQMKNLTSFNLNLRQAYITDLSLQHLGHYLSSLQTRLTSLTLNFSETQINDAGLLQLFETGNAALNNLKTLNLNLNGIGVSDTGLQSLAKSMLSIASLDRFTLYLNKTFIMDNSIEQLFLSCRSSLLKSLKTLEISFSDTKMTDRSLLVFAKYLIPSLVAVETFEMCLDNTHVTDMGIKQLCVQMKPSLKTVKSFTLNLGNTKITDGSLKPFTKHALLGFSSSLEYFHLSLNGTLITDNSIKQFGNEIKNSLKRVRVFKLILHETGISDKGIEALLELPDCTISNLREFVLSVENTKVSESMKRNIVSIQQKLSLKTEDVSV